MIGGRTGKAPYVIEYLPVDATTGSLNHGYSSLIFDKIEELDKKGELITAPIIEKILNIGKTTVIKHMKKFENDGLLNVRLAKLQYENTVVITPVYTVKKKKDATRKKRG
jgi:hypothetical protein